ncbi:uncharacterized protein LOC100898838 [Galendromus occidentalis]|uniref:Uncharacterized protein LOC100898838 n=1 Tax=Galendromus occidentalis TaxID=34638 RepID=A0AAJ7SEQ1_9ACAR|nr:uncharacterized protein LOC100898838 [Galendromus occidentalis]
MYLLHILLACVALARAQDASQGGSSSLAPEISTIAPNTEVATVYSTSVASLAATASTQPVRETTTLQETPTTEAARQPSPEAASVTVSAEPPGTTAVPDKGPAMAEKRVQTTEASGTETVPSVVTPQESTSAPTVQPSQSPRNPKYVDIDSIKHPPEEPPPEIPSRPFPQNITVRLENLACEYPQYQRPGLRIDVEKTFKQLSENITEVHLTDANCKMFLTLNITVTATDGDFKKLLAKLEEHVKNITVGEHMIITGFTLHDSGEHQVDFKPTVTRAGRFPTYREELIILIAVIILLIIVLFIACVICSIRCCRRTPSTKTLDILETQTPRSRSMDFSNRIPRAHTLYSPTASEYSGCLSPMTPFGPGIVQPFDTCLVPLEDVTPSAGGTRNFSAARAPAQRPNNLPIRQRVDFSPDKSRFRSYNYPPKHNRALPVTANVAKSYGKNASQSTEQLTKHHSLDEDSGVDNPTYLPTPSTPHVSSDIAETHKM